MEAVDDIAFLAASRPRAAILAALHDEQSLTRGELVDRCDAARVTVGRNLEQLRERGVVREEAGAYGLSLVGELLAEDFLALAETARTADELAPVLEHVPPDEFDLDPRALADADVTRSTRADPYAPVARHERTLRAASEARAVLPAVGPRPMETSVDRVVAGDLTVEFVVSDDVAATLTSAYADSIERMTATGDLPVYVYDGDVPYYLGLVDEAVQIGVDDEEGIPRALVEADDDAVREWAEGTYRTYRSQAEPFEPPR